MRKRGKTIMLHSFVDSLCFFEILADFFKVLQSYQTKLEAWTRICLSSGTHLFPPKSRLLSRNLFALSTCVSKWVIIASCSHFFKTYSKFITCFHKSWIYETLVFCYQNCSDLLWERIILGIEKNVWNSRLKAENFQNFWDP